MAINESLNNGGNIGVVPAQPAGQPVMQATQAQTPPENVNVQAQSNGLIDDVRNGSPQQSMTQEPVRDMGSARNALLQMIEQQNAAPSAETMPTAVQEESSMPIVSEPQGIPNQGMPESGQNVFGAGDITETIRAAINEAIAEGRLADLSTSDLQQEVVGQEASMSDGEQFGTESENHEIQIPDVNSDEFFEKFSSNPGEAIMEVADALAEQKMQQITGKLQPVLEQSEKLQQQKKVQEAIKQFVESGHQDFTNYRDDMVQILKSGNYSMDDPEAYEIAYAKAKAKVLESKNQELQQNSRSLDDYLQDSSAVDKIKSNEQIRKAIIEDYLKSLSDGGQPQVISSGGTTSPSAISSTKASNMKDAGKMFASLLQ